LNEINEADLKTYTPAQLTQILTQREHVSKSVQGCSSLALYML
jgi:hypothetical protein